MKNPTMLSFISLFLMAAWVTPACTKDVNQLLYVKDTVRITTHDTIRITTHDTLILGQDSVHANFVYTLSYQLPDSSGYEKISAENASLNAPLNAIYTWILDGNS